MIKTISTLLMVTTLFFSCEKVEEEPEPIVLVSHGSFEMEGTFTTDGWITNNTSSDPNTPVNGGVWSLRIDPDLVPEEGYADFIMNGLEGSKKYKLTACINSFDNWPGSVSLRKVDSGGGVTVLASESSDENAWILKTLDINTTFNAGDQLVIRLSGGSTEAPAPSKYVLFDLIELTEQ